MQQIGLARRLALTHGKMRAPALSHNVELRWQRIAPLSLSRRRHIIHINLHGCGLLDEPDSQHESMPLVFAQENSLGDHGRYSPEHLPMNWLTWSR